MIFAGLLCAETSVITEDDVVKAALENNPALASVNKMADAASAASHKEFWLPNPMVGIEYMGLSDSGLSLDSAAQKNLTVSQMVPWPFKYIWKAGAAVSRSDYARHMAKAKELEVISGARKAYYEFYKINRTIAITEEASSIVKQLSDIAFAKYNSGMAAQQDVLKADIENQTLQNEIQSLKRMREISLEKLGAITGHAMDLTSTVFDISEPAIPVLKSDFAAVKELILNNAPMVKAAGSAKNVSENMRNMAVADYIPDLKLTYKRMLGDMTTDYSLMIEAEIPIWFLNNQQADIGEKWAMSESGEKEFENAKNTALLEAREHYEIVNANYRTMDLYKNRLIPQTEAAVKSMTASYKSKKADFMALLDSERMLLEMKKDYYMKMEEYLMHYRMLEELTGKLLITNY